MTNPYTFTDNPMVSGVSVCNTDIVNDNIMALKWMHDHISYRSIGEIVSSTIPLTDSGLHLLDGALISGSGIYGDFVTYISGLVSTYPDLFTTESAWQSTVTQYGVCGKFVYDSTNNTVRLPKITGFVEGASGVSSLGDLTEAGLPDHTHSYTTHSVYGRDPGSNTPYWSGGNAYTGEATGTFTNASESNSIYGNSSTVQPQSVKVLYYIVIATSAKTGIQVDIDEIATDLNGKADTDLLNVPESRGILVEKSSKDILPRWYRVYADGWCEQGGAWGSNVGSYTTASVTYLKAYKDTNYQLFVQGNWSDPTASSCSVTARSTTGFTGTYANNLYSTMPSYWRACGYIR